MIERYSMPGAIPISRAVRAGGFLFLAGQLALDSQGQMAAGGVEAQTPIVMERIAATLEELGSSLTDVVRATVWLADMQDFDGFNREYSQHFCGAYPARSLVQASLYRGARVEIEVQALTSMEC